MKEIIFSETTVMTYLCSASEKQLQKLERSITAMRKINNYKKYGKRSQK